MEALRTRYIIENYDAAKKQMMGLRRHLRRSIVSINTTLAPRIIQSADALTSSYTWIPIFSFLAFGVA